jgi:cellulose synthase (UDP-forming)
MYLRKSQQRGLMVLTAVCFGVVAYSLVGFSVRIGHAQMGYAPFSNVYSYLSLLFLFPLTLYVITMLITSGMSVHERFTDLKVHDDLVLDWRIASGTFPTVDVFLPTAGEDLALLANTFQFVARLDWRGLIRVLVLDDSRRGEVHELAMSYGFDYLSRPNRTLMGKAGNLDYAFARSEGEFIVIFDADFVPRSDFLAELIPYFDEPTVGIVQSPQFFDTTKRMGWLQRSAGATQEIFYRYIQPSRDRVDASICVGTCAVYRRTALEAIGGFPQIGHSEDVYTGARMLDKGYTTRYVPVNLAKGLCPSDLSAFINQQYRWCRGSLALMRDAGFKKQQLTLRQRLCFWAGFLYYIGTGFQVVAGALPALIMIWFYPGYVKPINSLPLMAVALVWLAVLPWICTCKGLEVLRVQTVYGFAHLKSLWDTLRGEPVDWVPTNGGGKSTVATNVRLFMVRYLLVTQLLLLVGLAVRVPRFGFSEYWAIIAFAAFRLYIEVPLIWTALPSVRRPRRRTQAASPALHTPEPIGTSAALGRLGAALASEQA